MMLKRLQQLLWTTLLLTLAPTVSVAGFFVQNGQLLDANGAPFVMRGINYPFAWYTHRWPTQTQQDFANMAATGANAVRIVLATGGQWTRINGQQVADLIALCKQHEMIAVLEVHDSTGWSESGAAVPISNAVAYWTSTDIRTAINGQEDFVIINIANEPFGNTTTGNYVNDTIAAIQALRNAGLTHNLMVDAANWGQDWSGTMRNNAQQIFAADPLRNITFSVHMYEVYQNLNAVSSYMQAFDDMALPLVVGEFGADHQGQPVDEASIMAQAQARGNGYLGWSWSGNGGCCVSLDIVSNFGNTLTTWGNILVNGTNGIRATSVPATVFPDSTNTLTVSPTAVSFGAAAASAPASITANVNWSATDNASWVSIAPTSGSNNGSITISVTANTASSSRSATVTLTGGGLTRTIAVTQSGGTTQDFSLSANPSTLSVNRSASGTVAVNITRVGGFAGTVSFAASGLPSGVTATFSPPATNGASTTLTLSASSTASLGSATVTVTGTSGSMSRSVPIALTVNSGGGGGSVTATPVVANSSGWFTEQQLRLSNTAPITALSITIVVQRTPGVNASGQYNTVGGQIQQSVASTSSTITYQFTLASGQTLSPGTNRTFAVQMGGNGTVHPSGGDTYTVSYTAGGQTGTLSGTF